MPYCVSVLLMMPVFNSLGSEYLPYLTVFQAHSQNLFLAFKPVSAFVTVSNLLTMPILALQGVCNCYALTHFNFC
jgi:hypothetical protein